jgi:uncharacterized linocin/CFP29 family protein
MNTEAMIAHRGMHDIPGYGGGLASKLLANNFDVGCLREFIGEDRHVYYCLNGHLEPHKQVFVRKTDKPVLIPGIDIHPAQIFGTGAFSTGSLVTNRSAEDGPLVLNTPANLISGTAGALLTREEYERVDGDVLQVALPELGLWQRLRAAVPKNIPNGLSTIMMRWAAETDAGNATFSMSPARQAGRDRPTSDMRQAPLPIVHADFSFDIRELAVSRRDGQGLDTSMAQKSSRKVAEAVEKLTLGTLASYTYGGGTLYGLRNFPDRVTTTFTLPTDPAWTPETLINELLGSLQTLRNNLFRGPFVAFYSPGWWRFFGGDYSSAYNKGTVMSRVAEIPDIVNWQRLDYLPDYEIILVQLSSDFIQAVSGMDLTTVQWEEMGGMEVCFKIMAIQVPLIKSDARGDSPILHATAA